MERRIYTDIDFEHFLSRLFGKRAYHGFVGEHSLSTWKKELTRIVRTVQRAIRLNVDTDDFHRDDMLETCERAIQNIKAANLPDEASTAMIKFSVAINFMLLGQLPDHWENDHVSHTKYWKLDRYRKLIYIRTPEHKANLLIHL